MTTSKYNKQYYSEHNELFNEKSKKWAKTHREHLNAYQRKWRKEHPNEWRSIQLRRKYGITLETYNKKLIEQNGVCAICGKPDKNFNLAVDHDHRNGNLRGLLCTRCNTVLEFIEDKTRLDAAVKYLAKYRL